MDAGNPLLDDYVLRLTGVERPRVCFVPTASGDADHYVVRFYRTFAGLRLRAQPPVALPPRSHRGDRRPGRAPAQAGPDLRRRRLGHQPARRLARPRDRPRAERGVAARHRAVRAQRRIAVLVLGGGHRLPRRAAGGRGPRAAAAFQLRALRRRAVPAPGVPALHPRRHVRRATRPTTAPRCTSSGPTCTASWPRGPASAAGASRCAAIAWSSASCRPSTSAHRWRWSREDHPRPGRRRVHRPAGRPGARRARPAARGAARCRGSSSCPPPAATRATRSGASTPPSATVRASPRCSRSFAWATCAGRCATSSSPRTSSTSAAARCATCWPSGRSTAWTACCATPGSAGSSSPGSAPGPCAGCRAA